MKAGGDGSAALASSLTAPGGHACFCSPPFSEVLTKWSMSQEKLPDIKGTDIREPGGISPCRIGAEEETRPPFANIQFITLKSAFVRLTHRSNIHCKSANQIYFYSTWENILVSQHLLELPWDAGSSLFLELFVRNIMGGITMLERGTNFWVLERLKFQIILVFLLFQGYLSSRGGVGRGQVVLLEMHSMLYLSCQGQISDLEGKSYLSVLLVLRVSAFC